MTFFIGQGIQRRLGPGLDGQDSLHRRKREGPEAYRPLQGGDQVLSVIGSQQGQDLVGLVLAVALCRHQALQEAAGYGAQFREPLGEDGVLLAKIFTGQMGGLDAALSDDGAGE